MTFKDAREFMAREFEADPDFRRAYVDNIAMFLYDHNGADYSYKEVRDKAASDLLKLVIESQP